MNSRLWQAIAVVLIAAVLTGPRVGTQRDDARHVVVISIDGLKPGNYTRPGPARIPTLRRLMKEGAYACPASSRPAA